MRACRPPIAHATMPFVVTEACIQCRYTDCVDVCPMSCFHAGPNFLVIDPDGCIDCSLCVAECPVDAIYSADDVPLHQQHFIALNATLSQRADWPVLPRSEAPMPEHARWAGVRDKLAHLVTDTD